MNQAFQWNEKTPEVTAAFQQFKKDVDRLMKPFTETVCLEASDALYELVAMTERKRLKQKSGHVWYYCRLRIGGEACDKRLHVMSIYAKNTMIYLNFAQKDCKQSE